MESRDETATHELLVRMIIELRKRLWRAEDALAAIVQVTDEKSAAHEIAEAALEVDR